MQYTQAILFTDGASRGNPGPGGWGAIAAWDNTVREAGGREANTTNNRMELTAIVSGLGLLPHEVREVTLYTDSTYAMKGATQWVHGWQKNGWKTKTGDDVANRDIWEVLVLLLREKKVTWQIVAGHAGIPGNERVDVLATSYADGVPITLYSGTRAAYGIALDQLETNGVVEGKKDRSKQKAYSYLSLVRNVAVRHRTWGSCEERVKGVQGAKYRKAVSLEDELAILDSWGVPAGDIQNAAE